MGEVVRREIKPFNEFWINCESTMLHSLLITLDEKYRVLAYVNNYTYEQLPFVAPSTKRVNEVRVKPDIMDLYHAVFQNEKAMRWGSVDQALEEIKEFLRQGKIVMAGVDLFYWIPLNACYHKLHVEHYAIINGFNEEKGIFYVMDTDNVKYREFEMPADTVADAMAHCELPCDALIYDLCDKKEMESCFFDRRELVRRAKGIAASLRPLCNKYFWLMEEGDYKAGFYRDMSVMYILQINCRMKANRLLLEYLIEQEEKRNLVSLQEECSRLEMKWVSIKNRVSKAYFAENSVMEMMNLGEEMMDQFRDERQMWKQFIRCMR